MHAAAWQAGVEGFANGYNAAAGIPTGKLMLFGGPGHDVYLGCLSCNRYASDSVLNEYGTHGSPYQTRSIFNSYGDFGSRYSTYSACNPYASDPPVIVDREGRFYGRLTLNGYHRQATKNDTWLAFLAGVCGT